MKLVTLDFEGTLVNFQWKLTEAVDEVLSLLAREGVHRDYFDTMNYAAIYNKVQSEGEKWGFPSGQLTDLVDSVYDKYDLDACTRWEPVQGMFDVLDRLKKYKVALVSNIGHKGMTFILKEFGLEDSFGLVLNRNDLQFIKPDKEGLLKAIAWADVSKNQAIHVGDSLSDLHAARNAGVKSAIVLGGENDAASIIKETPDLLMENLSELPYRLSQLD